MPEYVYRLWDNKQGMYVAAKPYGAHRRTVWMSARSAKGVRTGMRQPHLEIHEFELVKTERTF